MPRLETDSFQFQYILGLAQLASPDRLVIKRGHRMRTDSGPIADYHLISHLNGGQSLSVFPEIDGRTRIAVLDLDDHERELTFKQVLDVASQISRELAGRGFHHRGFRSRGGLGVHIWMTWERPQPVAAVRRLMADVLAAVGHKEGATGLNAGDIEIFPKKGGSGGSISLPLSLQSVLLTDTCDDIAPSSDLKTRLTLENNQEDLLQLPIPTKRNARPVHAADAGRRRAVVDALNNLDADDRGRWIDFGLALKGTFEDVGFDIWLQWSSQSLKFLGEDDCRSVWEGLQPNGSITIASIYHQAKLEGWKPDASGEVADMNERYGILTKGNRTVIIDKLPSYEKDAPLVLLGTRPFKDRLQGEVSDLLVGQTSEVDNKGEGWMEHPHAARYDAVDFDPSRPPGDNGRMWNVWRGFSIEAKPGNWSLLQQHIKENIADNDVERAEWLINWMAAGIQYPSEVLGTAPVFVGPPGTGKTIAAQMYGRLWWPHDITLTSVKHTKGDFNEFLFGRRLVFLDEAFSGDKSGAGVMKTRLTDKDVMFEPKGLGAYRAKNRMIFMAASNEDRSVPADIGDRRWMIFPVGAGKQEDRSFFGSLTRQMKEGGLAAMLYDLQRRDLSIGPNPRLVIRSEALLEISLDSGNPVLRYLHDLLRMGVLPGSKPSAPNRSSAGQIFHDFQHKEPIARVSAGQLGRIINKVLGNISAPQVVIPNFGRTVGYDFPPLGVCRARYADHVRTPIDWGESTEWTPSDDGESPIA